MFKVVLKTIGMVLLIGYLVICGFIWRVGEPPMVYRDINVVICDSAIAQFVGKADIMRVVNSADSLRPIGKRADRFNTLRLEKALEKSTLIANADCYPTPDSILRIDIYQRHPILRVKSESSGRDYYVDINGEIMAFKRSKKAIDVPLATGHISDKMAKSQLYELAQYLNHHHKWDQEIVQIYVEPNQDICLIPRKGDHTIILGSTKDLDVKFDKLETFYDKVLDKKGWNAYKKVNLKFKGQVIGERRDK